MSEENSKIKLSLHDFYFETPLYEVVDFSNIENNSIEGSVDGYNPISKVETTFDIYKNRVDNYGWDGFHKIRLTCKRFGDTLSFFTVSNNESIMKIGQNPSLADIQYSEIGNKYDKYLSQTDLHDFKKAIGLASHGVGAGSYVYLRRIFENLIKEVFEEHKEELGLDDSQFNALRMEDKVNTLKEHLPSQLVQMKKIYGILSNGIHELSEEECLTYFPALKLSIELILRQKIEEKDKREKDRAVKDEIEKINQAIKK